LNFVIELDGKQHTKYPKMQERDTKKDEFLKTKGIKILRINWRDLFHNSRDTFNDVKNILAKLKICDIDIQNFSEKQLKRLNLLDEYKKKKEFEKQLEQQKYIIDEQKMFDMKDMDLYEWGTISTLARKWNLSKNQVRRMFRKSRLRLYSSKR
jgi:hypothetical protein